MDLDKVIRELQAEREQLREAIIAIERLVESRRQKQKPRDATPPPPPDPPEAD